MFNGRFLVIVCCSKKGYRGGGSVRRERKGERKNESARRGMRERNEKRRGWKE